MYLQALVFMVDGAPDSTTFDGITLQTTGGMVRGKIVPSEVWHQRWGDDLRAATGILAGAFGKLDEAMTEAVDSAKRPDPAGANGLPKYIHLVEATVHSGSHFFRVPLWRAPIHAVVGWALGQ